MLRVNARRDAAVDGRRRRTPRLAHAAAIAFDVRRRRCVAVVVVDVVNGDVASESRGDGALGGFDRARGRGRRLCVVVVVVVVETRCGVARRRRCGAAHALARDDDDVVVGV